ncbi:DUF721 domain-containing protein [Chlorobium phaeovibrioides]|uniref:DUF721 domain-containing protein n=1 Tax=Chlorobium phaeovibrioides TaxID=1094 RepID=A0ABW9UP08_CHLPH|nr:DUF721 domain-containing protein [Chlorobium phaeovibrioides]MWV54469.1 DUF721 domain-containing protein [Chlorobium phaeovibrioides]
MSLTRSPKKFSSIAGDMYRALGLHEAFAQFNALGIWNTVVGEAVAAVTTLERFTEGTIVVRVRSSTWRMELNYRKSSIIEKLNVALNSPPDKPLVRDIIFR